MGSRGFSIGNNLFLMGICSPYLASVLSIIPYWQVWSLLFPMDNNLFSMGNHLFPMDNCCPYWASVNSIIASGPSYILYRQSCISYRQLLSLLGKHRFHYSLWAILHSLWAIIYCCPYWARLDSIIP